MGNNKGLTGRFGLRALAGFLMLVLGCNVVFGQATAEISGTVRDQTGAVLPGVDVTATQTATGAVRAGLTNETGSYLLTNLPVGPYMVEVSLPGFRTYVQTGIVLQIGTSVSVNAVLEIGQVAETIEVQADAALVETRATGISQMIDNTRVLELPLNGRQVTELIFLAGVATQTTDASLNSGVRNYPTTVISVAGGMNNGLVYVLDGGTHNDPENSLNLPMPFPDALQEFKVETSGLQAQYGQHAAGTMNAVTKSGTNQFHGSLFEFVRNPMFNARNAYSLVDDGIKKNQFGGTFGGPVLRNRLFFFGAYQGTLERRRPSDFREYIPTAAMMAGDFTTIASPACNAGRQVTLRAPFVNNRIDPSSFSRVTMNLLNNSLFPKTNDPCGEIRYQGGSAAVDEHLYVGRVDFQWTDKNSMFWRYMGAARNPTNDFDGKNILTNRSGALQQRMYSLVLGDTYLIGSGTVSSFRATALYATNPRVNPDILDFEDIGVKGLYINFPGHMRFTVNAPGFVMTGVNVQPGHYNSTGFQFAEDISHIKGNHQIGFGANFIHTIFNGMSGVVAAPNFTFSTNRQTGFPLADFMLGLPSAFSHGTESQLYPRSHYLGTYLQDTWKMTPRFTLNAGLRWEPYLSPYDGLNRTNYFSRELFDKGVRSTSYPKAPIGLMFPGDPGRDEHYNNHAWLRFAPRLGFAWDVNGNGLMTVRAAYGIYNDFPHLWTYYGAGANAPWNPNISITNPVGGWEEPWRDYPGGNPFPLTFNKTTDFLVLSNYLNQKPDAKSPYANQWNLSIQRQVGTEWLLAANYLGNSSMHVWGPQVQLNPAVYMPGTNCVINEYRNGAVVPVTHPTCSTAGNVNQRRVLSLANPVEGRFYQGIGEIETGGTASYNAMLLSVQRRRSNGLTVQGNYTWSHGLGDNVVSQPGANGVEPGTRGYQRGNFQADRRHVVNVSTVYETPQFGNRTARILGSGWQISGIVRLQSGNTNLTVESGANTALRGAANETRAHQVLANPYAENKTIDNWLNPAAFARPANGEYGNAANSLHGPGSIRIDMGLTRRFQVTEGQSIEFRAEAFNMPNHLNPNTTDAFFTLGSPTFGRVTTAQEPRIMQFALKYVF